MLFAAKNTSIGEQELVGSATVVEWTFELSSRLAIGLGYVA